MKSDKLFSIILSVAMAIGICIHAPLALARSELSVAGDADQPAAAATSDQLVNLALNKTVTASSSYESGVIGKKYLVDGVRGVTLNSFGWSSDVYNTGDTTWVWATVDLGASYTISRIDLYPRDDPPYAGNNFPVNFELKVSFDNKNWTVVRRLTDYPLNPTGVQSFSFEPRQARFVRVEGLGVKTWMYGMQLAEMEVYGDPSSGQGATGGIHADGKLQVRVENASGVPLDVEFYKRSLIPADLGELHISGFENEQAMEIPAYYPKEYGDVGFSSEALNAIAESDDVYEMTESLQNSPYQRFDLQFDEPIESEAYVTWEGRTDQTATLYVWDFTGSKWESLASATGSEIRDIRLTGKFGPSHVQNGKAHFMIAAAQSNIVEEGRLPSTGEYDFTFVWETDTQYYSRNYPDIFTAMNRWIAGNKDALNIKYVIHTGDIVQNWNALDQWQVADAHMNIIEEAGIPYGVVSGNHDVNAPINDYEYYGRYFGRDRFAGHPWYGGDLHNNRHHYDLISAGGIDFIIVYLGIYGRLDPETVDWANRVLRNYKDRYAIVATHAYINSSGNYGVNGKEIMEEIVAPNENVFLTLNGHYHGANYNVKRINGRVVYEVMSDYQEGPEGGQGYVRLLQFDAGNKRMYMNTYSPYKDDYNYFNDALEQATFPLDTKKGSMRLMTDRFSVSTEWTDELIGTVGAVVSGPVSTGIDPDTILDGQNEWFVKLVDADGDESFSETWRFQEPSYLDSALVDGNRMTLKFDKPLQSGTTADPADFAINVQGAPTVVRSVYVQGNEVQLTLSRDVKPDRSVTVTYSPGSSPLRDYAGYRVERFVNVPVVNETRKPGHPRGNG